MATWKKFWISFYIPNEIEGELKEEAVGSKFQFRKTEGVFNIQR